MSDPHNWEIEISDSESWESEGWTCLPVLFAMSSRGRSGGPHRILRRRAGSKFFCGLQCFWLFSLWPGLVFCWQACGLQGFWLFSLWLGLDFCWQACGLQSLWLLRVMFLLTGVRALSLWTTLMSAWDRLKDSTFVHRHVGFKRLMLNLVQVWADILQVQVSPSESK